MTFSQALQIRPGITAVIGSGGKSTLLEVLARELGRQGTVVLCTTTRMYPARNCFTLYDPDEETLGEALKAFRVICVGRAEREGKLSAPGLPMDILCHLADFVLVEADGAKRLPLKAHAPYEPVIPHETGQTICVVGLSGLGKTVRQAAHRPERYAKLARIALEDPVPPQAAARVLRAEGLGDRVLLNQADDEHFQALGRTLQAELTVPTVIGSLWKGLVLC